MAIHERDKDKRMDACVTSLRHLATTLGRTPSEKEYKLHYRTIAGAPTPNQLRYVYGEWTAALLAAGLTPLPTDPPRNDISKDELVEEFTRVANELGRLPSLEVFRKNSKFSNRPYQTRWGNWREVQSYFVSNHANNFTFVPDLSRKTGGIATRRPLDLICPLVYEPRNEMETIALFTLLAKDLGYRILSIRADFPDAILEKDGIEYPTEFEFLSSNYVAHCHERSPEILCICWRVDCDLSPVRVLCLENVTLSSSNRNTNASNADHT